jgi:uncharacterized protein (UPF0332 family)
MSAANQAKAFWERAEDALRVANHVLPLSPDSAASRAYYAAFHAVSALFALEGRTFRKHSALEAAVHRDLVKPGKWDTSLGEQYSRLVRLRNLSDYGAAEHVSPVDAREAVEAAEAIVRAVGQTDPRSFPRLQE